MSKQWTRNLQTLHWILRAFLGDVALWRVDELNIILCSSNNLIDWLIDSLNNKIDCEIKINSPIWEYFNISNFNNFLKAGVIFFSNFIFLKVFTLLFNYY